MINDRSSFKTRFIKFHKITEEEYQNLLDSVYFKIDDDQPLYIHPATHGSDIITYPVPVTGSLTTMSNATVSGALNVVNDLNIPVLSETVSALKLKVDTLGLQEVYDQSTAPATIKLTPSKRLKVNNSANENILDLDNFGVLTLKTLSVSGVVKSLNGVDGDITLTVSDSDSINLSLDNFSISATANFGTSPGSVAEGDHTHNESEIIFTDIVSGNSSTTKHGYLPKLAGDTTNFLRADGTWSTPVNTKDTTSVTGILKGTGSAVVSASPSDITGQTITGYSSTTGTLSENDTILQAISKLNGNIGAGGNGTVMSVSVINANGVSGSVATESTTPAITLKLNAITPTSVNSITLSGTNTPSLSVSGASLISGSNTGDNAVNSKYSSLVSNALHTGDVSGSTTTVVRGINNTLLSSLGTGILKNTTGTGVPSIAIASDFPTLNQNTTGNAATATKFSTNRTNYKTVTDTAVCGEMMWKEFGNGHTIFDASDSTSPDGVVINNINPENNWVATYPTLMGWNGSGTYGVRVDRCRLADTSTSATSATSTSGINNVQLSSLGTGILKNTTGTGVPSIAVSGDFPILNQNTTGSAGSLNGFGNPTNNNTGSTIVYRDSGGDFSARYVTVSQLWTSYLHSSDSVATDPLVYIMGKRTGDDYLYSFDNTKVATMLSGTVINATTTNLRTNNKGTAAPTGGSDGDVYFQYV